MSPGNLVCVHDMFLRSSALWAKIGNLAFDYLCIFLYSSLNWYKTTSCTFHAARANPCCPRLGFSPQRNVADASTSFSLLDSIRNLAFTSTMSFHKVRSHCAQGKQLQVRRPDAPHHTTLMLFFRTRLPLTRHKIRPVGTTRNVLIRL